MDGRNVFIGLLTLSLLCLAASIVFFTLQLMQFTKEIPKILAGVDHATQKIEQVVREAEQVRALVPAISAEMTETRNQVPLILYEVAEFRKQIPLILKQVQASNRSVANAMQESQRVRQQIPQVLQEFAKIRALVPVILTEIKNTREALPPMLSELDKITTNAQQLGQKTTEGALTGVFTGILKAPFEIVGGLGSAIFGATDVGATKLSDADLDYIKVNTYQLLAASKPNEKIHWLNPASGNKGTILLKRFVKTGREDCRILNYKITMTNQQHLNKDVKFCLNAQAKWIVL